VRALAPAKVNLGLRIVGRRRDGRHELESVFAPLDLADELALEVGAAPASEVSLALSGRASGVPAGGGNLAVRAAHGFLRRAGLRVRVHIALEKRIPMAAGLGGGSSDAGAVLRALDAAFPGALPRPELEALALELGADVPFFLEPAAALVGGIGERREPLGRGLPALTLLLANPGVALSTGRVFEAFDALARPGSPGALARALAGLPDGLPEQRDDPASRAWQELLVNDLEEAALRLCPPMGRLREALRASGAPVVAMSGSGATLYALFPGPERAEAARATLPGSVWARVARTLESR
jgi:4-diphosphocytidyl-2-C-methyl-D-erythritol kinase